MSDLGLDTKVTRVTNIAAASTGWAAAVEDFIESFLSNDADNPFGSAALVDTGTASGNVPVLDTSGDLAVSVIPNLPASIITTGTINAARIPTSIARTSAIPTNATIDERARDAVGAALVGARGISIGVNDSGNQITLTGPDLSTYALSSAVPSNTDIDERARDAVGNIMSGTRGINVTYTDSGTGAGSIVVQGPDLSTYATTASLSNYALTSAIPSRTTIRGYFSVTGDAGLSYNSSTGVFSYSAPAGETGAGIVTKLAALSGTARLNVDHLRGDSGTAGRFLRVNANGDISPETVTIPSAETGGSIVTKLNALSGTARLSIQQLRSTGTDNQFLRVSTNGDIVAETVTFPSALTATDIVREIGTLTGTNRLHLNRLRVNTSSATTRYMVANAAGDLRTTTLNIPAAETGASIVTKLAALTGGNRLNVAELRSTVGTGSRVLYVSTAGDIFPGAAPTGGGSSETGATIVTKLAGLTGTNRLNVAELRANSGSAGRFLRVNSNGDISALSVTIPSAETGGSIVTKLAALTGTNRLQVSDLRSSTGAAGRFLGVDANGNISAVAAPSGGGSSETGTSIVTKLAGLTGTNRLNVAELRSTTTTGSVTRYLGVNNNGDISPVISTFFNTGTQLKNSLESLSLSNKLSATNGLFGGTGSGVRYLDVATDGSIRVRRFPAIPSAETGTTIVNKLAGLSSGLRLNIQSLRGHTSLAGKLLSVDSNGNIIGVDP